MKVSTHYLSIALLLAGTAFAFGQDANRNQNTQPAGGNESLGSQLLEGLGGDVNKSAPATKPAAKEGVTPGRVPAKFDDLGDDLGGPSGPLPLVRARQSMSEAGTLLAKPGSVADARAEQQQAVSLLDELINQLSKQCQGGNCPPGDKPPQPNPQPKFGAKAGMTPGTSTIGPRDSSADLKRPDVRPVDMGERESLVKRIWGQLPERSRQQMQQSYSGEFLPKYELELEKYYRRLAEPEAAK